MALFFDDYDDAISKLNEDWNNIEILHDTEKDLLMEGDIILKYLNNTENISEIKNKKCLLLEGPDDATILILYSNVNDRIEIRRIMEQTKPMWIIEAHLKMNTNKERNKRHNGIRIRLHDQVCAELYSMQSKTDR